MDGVDLDVRPGEFFTLLGSSGSGKTTILRLIAGFEQATGGSIRIDGREVAGLSPAKRGVGVVFQHYALFPHLTVDENIAYALKLRRVRRDKRRARVDEMLSLVQLEGYGERYPRELSGGQQQRIAVARALAFAPSLLLMDEPLGALDRALRRRLEEELRRIHQRIGTTVIYVTHDQEEALALSDRTAVMSLGKFVQVGTAKELYERPSTEFVARFFGECNIFDVEVRDRVNGGAAVAVAGETLVANGNADADRVGLVVRPERLRLAAGDGDIRVDAHVEDVLYLGESVRISAQSERLGHVIARVDPRAANGLAQGAGVSLYFSPQDAVLVGRS